MLRFSRIPPLRLILALGMLHGLLYLFIVPPWQHYDEPTHFEYSWLVANRSGLPMSGEFDQGMRRAVASSMTEYNFFRGMDLLPDLDTQNEAIWIGFSQVDDPPFYYILVSLPLRLLSSWDITWQLYAGRFVSLGLYLVSIVAAWGIMGELVSAENPLRWLVPASMVLIPSYVDLMTSINNDVGATVIFSLFLWGSVRIIRQGFSLWRFLWVVIAAVLCYWTKNTVLLALPLLGLVLLLSLFPGRWRWFFWGGAITAIPLILVAVFSWGDALLWIRSPGFLQTEPTRVRSAQAPYGRYVMRMEISPSDPSYEVFQLLPEEEVIALRGRAVTLGAWIWAARPIVVNAITLFDGQQSFSHEIQLSTSPKFFALSAILSSDASHARVILEPGSQRSSDANVIFYDGLVLVKGARLTDAVPQFSDLNLQQGIWEGQAFTNLLRNASGEAVGPGIRPWPEENRPELLIYSSPELVLGSLFNWRGSGWYYQMTAQNLLHTFWAKFGWGHIPLSLPFTNRPYIPLAMLTLAGLGGTGIALWHRRFILPWNVLLFLSIALAGLWGQTILRGIHSLVYSSFFIPSARYAYPVIIPTILALNAGWLEIAYFLESWVHLTPRVRFWVYGLFFLGLDIASLSTVFSYYYIH